MNNIKVIVLIVLALIIGVVAGYYYALSKVEAEPLSEEALEQINPFSDTNTTTNPFEYVNPFE